MSKAALKRPTLKTIAEIAGLAVPTVSRALSDAPDIGAGTKERVQRIARDIGYVPNRAGVRLKTGKTHVLALVLSTDHGIVNRTARLVGSTAGAIRGSRYHLNVTPYFADEDPMIPVRYVVETQSADAIILNQTQPEDPRVAYLLDHGFPFATHGRTNWSARHSWYDFDNHAFTASALGLMAERGRRKVLVIAPPPPQFYAQDILRASREAAAQGTIATRILDGAHSDDLDDTVFAATTRALREDPAIDGILAASTTAAMAATVAIEAVGRRVGEDTDLVGKETSPLLHLFRPKIITYHEEIARAGEFLAKAAIRAVEDPDAPPDQFLEVPERGSFRTGEDSGNWPFRSDPAVCQSD